MTEEPDLDPQTHPAVRHYTLLCLLSLLVLTLGLAQLDVGGLALLPLLAGSVAVAACWSVGPPLVLICLGGVMFVQLRARGRGLLAGLPGSFAADLAVCVAALAYVMGQYRLQSLVRNVFPPDYRRKRPRGGTPGPRLPPPEQPRSPDLVGQAEWLQLVLTALVVAGLASTLWSFVVRLRPALGFDSREWQGLLLVWAGGSLMVLAGTVAGYLRLRKQTPEESLMYLQDQLWRETRREQSRLTRWLVWARLRRQRKLRRKEIP
jgi:hypothetical protein